MEDIAERIRKNRPNITESSVKAYTSTIANLYKQIQNTNSVDNKVHSFFCNNADKVIDFLEDKPPSRRKTIMAGLVVFCDDEDATKKYRSIMMDDDKKNKNIIIQQEMTDKQKENWVSQDELKKIYNQLEKEARPLFTKEKLTAKEYQHLQNYVILSIYTIIEPRRLMDYTEMKLKNFDREKDNFYEKGRFVYNVYKSAKHFGTQEYFLPSKLSLIVKKWIKVNDGEYLLNDINGNKLAVSQLQQRLNKILGRQASVNILRHSFLTEKYKDVPELVDMKQTATAMAHSLPTALEYVKKK
jgi:integrase